MRDDLRWPGRTRLGSVLPLTKCVKYRHALPRMRSPPDIAERRKLLSGVAGVEAVDMSGIPHISTRRGQLDARDEN